VAHLPGARRAAGVMPTLGGDQVTGVRTVRAWTSPRSSSTASSKPKL
jgi:hypothetical protein